jgi:hypothetical protein
MFVTDRDDIIDIVYKLRNSFIHKQIEVKNGMLFMRAKKRPIKTYNA